MANNDITVGYLRNYLSYYPDSFVIPNDAFYKIAEKISEQYVDLNYRRTKNEGQSESK